MSDDARFMALALSLGRRGLGRVAPWPSVGCVIVKHGRILGRGTSDRTTMRHAERVALDQAGEAARGATVYVTLEPCAHHGNTPPCADALAKAGVARVVVALGDPNPQVNGQGLARLRAAGIAVELGTGSEEAARDNAGFLLTQTDRRPMVTLKLAASLDGRIATATGESRWITGPQARRAVHAMRASHDAVMIGAGTARADDPMLDIRDMGATHQPVRVVLSRALDLPTGSRLARSAATQPLWLVHTDRASPETIATWEEFGAKCLSVPLQSGQIDIRAALGALASEGLTRIFCEGGGNLAASLLRACLADRLITFTSGLAIGADGQPALGPLGVERLANAPRFRLDETRRIGPDNMQVWTPFHLSTNTQSA